jgi:hypothetical protein
VRRAGGRSTPRGSSGGGCSSHLGDPRSARRPGLVRTADADSRRDLCLHTGRWPRFHGQRPGRAAARGRRRVQRPPEPPPSPVRGTTSRGERRGTAWRTDMRHSRPRRSTTAAGEGAVGRRGTPCFRLDSDALRWPDACCSAPATSRPTSRRHRRIRRGNSSRPRKRRHPLHPRPSRSGSSR